MMRMPSSEMFSPAATSLILACVAEHDGRAQPQRVKLPRRLQNARLLAFGKNDPLRMPLQFFDDIADETHERSFKFQVSSCKFCFRRNFFRAKNAMVAKEMNF